MTAEIPSTLDALTPEWLTAVLRESGALPTGRVLSRTIEPIGEGMGFTGSLARVHLETEPSDAPSPKRVVAKLPGTNRKNRAMVELVQGYEHEVRFFQELAGLSGLAPPRCHYAAMDPDPLEARGATTSCSAPTNASSHACRSVPGTR